MGSRFDVRRFIPFVVMHVFEGLLFSDCAAFSRGIDRPDLEFGLQGDSGLDTRSRSMERLPYWKSGWTVCGPSVLISTTG
jgi:hypothetical protein